MKESLKQTMVHGIGRECQTFYLRLAQINLKRETFRNRFEVIEFEQKFILGC